MDIETGANGLLKLAIKQAGMNQREAIEMLLLALALGAEMAGVHNGTLQMDGVIIKIEVDPTQTKTTKPADIITH